jgi:antitoxin PrlF
MQDCQFLRRVSSTDADSSVLEEFLVFLANDLSTHPDQLKSVGREFVQRVKSLVRDGHVDLDASLTEEDE